MASADPPRQDLPIFDPSVFIEQIDGLSQAEADLLYLKFPNAQGTENLQATNINGVLTTNGGVSFAQVGIGSVTSLAAQPLATDSTTNVPTTAWVQSAITAGGGTDLANTLIAGNSAGTTDINMNENNITTVNDIGAKSFTIRDAVTGVVTTSKLIQSGVSMALKNEVVAGEIGLTSLRTDTVSDTSLLTNMTNTVFKSQDIAGTASNITLTIDKDNVRMGVGVYLEMNSNSIAGILDTRYIGDSTIQSSAYTGAGASVGAYTNADITLDANGKITAITSGSSGTNLLPLNNAWTGTNFFNNTLEGSLTSNALQPAVGDNTTKIPTTAWVQSLVSAGPQVITDIITETTSQTVNFTFATGVTSYDLQMFAFGGNAGLSVANGGNSNMGGAGSAGMLWTNVSRIPISGGQTISFRLELGTGSPNSTTNGCAFYRGNSAVVGFNNRISNGRNGTNATVGVNGVGGNNSGQSSFSDLGDADYISGYVYNGSGGGNGTLTPTATPTYPLGGVLSSNPTQGDNGSGQQGGGGSVPATAIPFARVIITSYKS